MIQMPPRHGKSRTLCLFSAWILGKDNSNKIITASFNDDLAQDFSRNTRDTIAAEKNLPDDWIYSDIFTAKIKQGDASYQKWALEGQYFNYKGAGIGSSITGRGGNYLIVDDPVKDAETAYSETALDKIWRWYTGTFLSRGEHAKQIVCQTPWASKDVGGRLLAQEKDNWYLLSMPACEDGEMLCEDILTLAEYKKLKDIGDERIIAANYDMVRVDVKGALYGDNFQTYKHLPNDIERRGIYIDTADEGSDCLCAIAGIKSNTDFYITDVLFTPEAQEITEPATANMVKLNETREVIIESNNGGRAFARNVQRLLESAVYSCGVEWFHQSENKQSRILTNAATVKAHIFFPEGWEKRWPEFHLALISYQRVGKNKHDDAPDAITGICEKFLTQQPDGCY